MNTFELHRDADETGISGTGIVAQGVEFDDGTCVIRWLTATRSTATYGSMDDLRAIHGHDGKTRILYTGDAFRRGMQDCAQDDCENCAFASIGGPDARATPVAPKYVSPTERQEYLDGYVHAAREMYGVDWKTCSFGWAPALTVGAQGADAASAGKEQQR